MARPGGYSSEEDDSDYEGLYLNDSDSEQDKSKSKGLLYQNNVQPDLSLEQQLFDAVKTGDYKTVEELIIEKSAKINHVENGWSSVMYAAFYSQPQILKFLLEHGGNAKFHRDFFTTIMAISNGMGPEEDRLECVKLLVTHGAEPDEVDRYKTSALMLAAKAGLARLVKQLIELGCKVNRVDKDGAPALFYAVKENRSSAVDVLLKAGADIKLRDRHGYLAFDYAETKNFKNLLDKLKFEDSILQEFKNVNFRYVTSLEDLLEEMPSRNGGTDLSGFPNDIYEFLSAMRLQRTGHIFYDNKMQLGEFLQATEEKLKTMGVRLSYQRRVILESLKRFHLQRWLRSSISYKPCSEQLDSMDCVKMVGTVVRQLHVLQASLLYLNEHLPKDGLTDETKELLDKAAHQCLLLRGECSVVEEFASALDKKQKLFPADLIERKHNPPKFNLLIVSGLCVFAVGMSIWRKKPSLFNPLNKFFC